MMSNLVYVLITAAATFYTASLALATPDARPGRDTGSVEQMRERPADNARSRYPDTGLDKGPSELSNTAPPENGHSMDMNDPTNDINDSTLEVPNLNSRTNR